MTTNKFGMYVKFTTQPGQRDAFAELLLEAAAEMKSVQGCDLYVINVADDEPDVVWVTEVWSDSAAHAASLTSESTQAMIGRARPMIAGVEQIKLSPLGGKGI